jgi:uncharacterized repeat protein (TIGR01451 family)
LGEVLPGGVVVYNLSYGNIGNQDATGVVIEETVPENTTFDGAASTPGWSCTDGAPAGAKCLYTVGALGVGESGSVKFAVTADATLTGVSRITNTASIGDNGSNGSDLNPGDNKASDRTPVNAGEILADATSAEEEGVGEIEAGAVAGVEEEEEATTPLDFGELLYEEALAGEEEVAGERTCQDSLWWILILLGHAVLALLTVRRSEELESSALVRQVVLALVSMVALWRFFCTAWLPLAAGFLGLIGLYLSYRKMRPPS